MLPLLAGLSPNAAVLLLTFGVALIAIELNRPGWFFPGAFGLLLTLLATASLLKHNARLEPAVQIIISMALLLLQARRNLHWILAVSATILLVLSLARLLPGNAPGVVSAWLASLAGVVLGAGTTVLTRIARRARQNKGLD